MVGEAHAAVKPPFEENQAQANAQHLDKVDRRSPPTPESQQAIDARDVALKNATPATLEQMDEFHESGKADAVREAVLASVRGEVRTVDSAYGDLSTPPMAAPPTAPTADVPPPQAAQRTGELLLGEGVVPDIPATDLDMSEHKDAVDEQMKEEGIAPETLAEVDSGPLADARGLRENLHREVEEGPVRIQEEAERERAAVRTDLAGEERAVRETMVETRKGRLGAARSHQTAAQRREEQARQKVTDDLKAIFNRAKEEVDRRLTRLETESLERFDRGQQQATAAFDNRVHREMDAFKDDRYSGVIGKGKWVWDKFAGIEDHPRVLAIFEDAKREYVNRLDTLIARITEDARRVVAECKEIISGARDDTAKYQRGLRPGLRKIAAAAANDIFERLDALETGVDEKARALEDKLAEKRAAAIKALDEKIEKMKEALKGLAAKIGKLILNALLKLFKWALEKVGANAEQIIDTLKRAASAFVLIIKHPVRFLGNLIKSLAQGFSQFADRIWEHLKAGFLAWLFGTMAEAGIDVPKAFTVKAVIGLILQVLGLTVTAIERRVAKVIGPENVERIKQVWEFVSTFVREGVAGVWELIKEHLANLKEAVMSSVQNWLITEVVKAAVVWLASLFNPVAAIVKAIIAIYKVVKFIIERIKQILAVVEAILSSLAEIASGAIGKAADWIEKTLARLIPVVIGFLASLLGIGGITAKVRDIIRQVQGRVEKALDAAINKVAGKIAGLFKRPGAAKTPPPPEHLSPEMQQRWTQGQAAIEQLKKKPLEEPDLTRALAAIKSRYGFKRVDYELQGDEWVITSEMNPKDKDTVKAAGIPGTPSNPLPLKWPKRPSAKYEDLYLGGEIGKLGLTRSQTDMKARQGKTDETGTVVKRYTPEKADQKLADGETKIGLPDDYRTYTGKVVGPLGKQGTKGGGKINRVLKRYGFDPEAEGKDGDHVVERQIGGPDVIENLWPLDASENRGAGAALAGAEIPFPGGQIKKISELKEASRQYWFKIKSFKS